MKHATKRASLAVLAVSLALIGCGGNDAAPVSTAPAPAPAPATDSTAPTIPSALVARNITSTGFTLQWAASTDNVAVSGYEVYLDSRLVATLSATSHAFIDLAPSSTYAAQVRARDAAGNLSARSTALNVTTPATPSGGAAPLVSYDFTAGDTFVNKNGWSFAGTVGPIAGIPGTNAMGLRFRYPGAVVDSHSYDNERCAWIEQPATMPPAAQEFYLEIRLHVPTNYAHRSDVGIKVAPGSSISGWQLGDRVRSADDTFEGTISGFDTTLPGDGGIAGQVFFLRNAGCAGCDYAWVGSLRNLTRNLSATTILRRMIAANNKLMAVFADGYSAHGNGSTIVWEYWPNDPNAAQGQTPRASELAVHYSPGRFTGAGSHLQGTAFIGPNDFGKYIDVLLHGKFSNPAGARNGVIGTWLRREGATNYTRIHQVLDADMDKRGTAANPGTLVPWQQAKLLGWANSCFDTQTDFHISRIRYYDARPSGL